mmetsp:Transcript_2030/g.6580  ORF Transcript_2030/g.6580 Transcript_2030/m.6580 type:complete len:293 (+) Transcript_2030:656-1534(+)
MQPALMLIVEILQVFFINTGLFTPVTMPKPLDARLRPGLEIDEPVWRQRTVLSNLHRKPAVVNGQLQIPQEPRLVHRPNKHHPIREDAPLENLQRLGRGARIPILLHPRQQHIVLERVRVLLRILVKLVQQVDVLRVVRTARHLHLLPLLHRLWHNLYNILQFETPVAQDVQERALPRTYIPLHGQFDPTRLGLPLQALQVVHNVSTVRRVSKTNHVVQKLLKLFRVLLAQLVVYFLQVIHRHDPIRHQQRGVHGPHPLDIQQRLVRHAAPQTLILGGQVPRRPRTMQSPPA